jgi:hypothetical protein
MPEIPIKKIYPKNHFCTKRFYPIYVDLCRCQGSTYVYVAPGRLPFLHSKWFFADASELNPSIGHLHMLGHQNNGMVRNCSSPHHWIVDCDSLAAPHQSREHRLRFRPCKLVQVGCLGTNPQWQSVGEGTGCWTWLCAWSFYQRGGSNCVTVAHSTWSSKVNTNFGVVEPSQTSYVNQHVT